LRASRTTLTAGLLLASSLALLTAPGAAVATERAASRDYHTLTKIKKAKVQACVGPVRETGVGPGVPLYIRLNNKGSNGYASARITTNLLDTDYYAKPHRSDASRHAIISPDEMVTVKLAAYHKVVDFQIVATSIGAC
jgi:hypothetical protein